MTNKSELLPVREWLSEFYCMSEGNLIRQIIGEDIWNAEVESVEAANALINTRIETHISWAKGFKRKLAPPSWAGGKTSMLSFSQFQEVVIAQPELCPAKIIWHNFLAESADKRLRQIHKANYAAIVTTVDDDIHVSYQEDGQFLVSSVEGKGSAKAPELSVALEEAKSFASNWDDYMT